MPEIFLEVLIVILLGILITTSVRAANEQKKIHMTDHNALLQTCAKLTERLVKVETKTDIYLEHAGFDIPKIDHKIRHHMEDLKQNDRPTVGCIDIKDLYKDKEG